MTNNITTAGTDFSKWRRNNLERLAVELTAEVLRLRVELDAARDCPHCGPACDLISRPALEDI